MENVKTGFRLLCLKVKTIHDSHMTVLNNSNLYLRDQLLKIFESPKIDWYHYQGATLASNIYEGPFM